VNTNEVKFDWSGIVTKGDDAWRLSTVNKQIKPHFSVNHWQQVFLNGNKEVAAGDWHHFAGVYDGRQLRLYVDGQPDASIDWDGGIATNDFNVLIGENGAMKGRLWKGLLDDVRIYSFALSKEDIAAVFQGSQPQAPETVKIKIKFDEPLKAAKREK
jgi:beta-galactosidase